MKLESATFVAGGMMIPQNTCDGADLSPPLKWDEPPPGTQSFALIVDDPDAPRGTFVHWVLFDLPAELHQLPEGVPLQPKLPNGGVHGINDFRKLGYGGPCPPSGTHRYFFKLYALDRKVRLAPGANKAQLEAAMKDCILAIAELMGRYTRQQ